MKKITVLMCSLMLVLSLAGAASAVPTTWEDTVDWNPNQLIKNWNSVTYTHDISDGTDGFNGYLMGGNDIIWDYSLSVALSDDGGKYDGCEIAFIDQPGAIGDGFYDFNYNNEDFGWSLKGLVSLNLTGGLEVTISSWAGDFYLDWSKLVAHGDNGTAPVPEPATLLLLGTGLLGVVGANRKRFGKKK